MADFTENGIHKPTAEAFYLVLLSFSSIESRDEIDRIMSAAEYMGPLR